MENGSVQWRPLYVSSVVGGPSPENRGIRDAIRRLAETVDGLSWTAGDNGSADGGRESGVDVVFHVAGPIVAPDYAGVRTGRFSKADSVIAVQVAVPTSLEDAPDEAVARSLSAYLVEAAELARGELSRRRGAPPVRQAVDLARRAMESIVDE